VIYIGSDLYILLLVGLFMRNASLPHDQANSDADLSTMLSVQPDAGNAVARTPLSPPGIVLTESHPDAESSV
jgi:hypothetical protein